MAYHTKTGIQLKVIQGEGLGDGILRGQLCDVKDLWRLGMRLSHKPIQPTKLDVAIGWLKSWKIAK